MYIRFLLLRAMSGVEMNGNGKNADPLRNSQSSSLLMGGKSDGQCIPACEYVRTCTCSHEWIRKIIACVLFVHGAFTMPRQASRVRDNSQGFTSRTSAVSHWSFVLFSRQLPSVDAARSVYCVEVAPRWEQPVNEGWGPSCFANTKKRGRKRQGNIGGTSGIPKRA